MWGVLVAAMCVSGCHEETEEPRPENTPGGVVEKFVVGMQRVHGDQERGAQMVELLWKPARQNLAERAKRATAAFGRVVGPSEMLAPSAFSLSFVPRHYQVRIDGNWAEVKMTGDDPRREIARARCVRENDEWRLALDLSPLPPIRKRIDEER